MFIRGKTYVRRDLHRQFGGQGQGGISTPVDHPIIFIFTGEQGEQYGYRDGWIEDGVFLYTGEGQHNDMAFVRGNRAIRDHSRNGKDLHLFEYVDRGLVRYLGQMVYAGFQRRDVPDLDGNIRSVIVFQFLPLDSFDDTVREHDDAEEQLARTPMDELRRRALEVAQDPRPPHESRQFTYYRSTAVKVYVLRRADGRCEACGQAAPFTTSSGRPYLEPHHIRRLSDGGPDHPESVIGLCPNCHRRAHHSADRAQFNTRIGVVVLEKEHGM